MDVSKEIDVEYISMRTDAEALSHQLPALRLQAQQLVKTLNTGTHGRRKAGAGEDFWQFRSYNTQDAASNIDWRQSARQDQLYIRQQELETAETVWFWVDHTMNMAFKSQKHLPFKVEAACILSLATGLLLVKGGENFGAVSKEAKASHGPASFERFAHEIISSPVPFQKLTSLLPVRSKSRFILVSDFLYDRKDLETVFDYITSLGREAVLVHIADPVEITFPFEGRAEFKGLDSSLSVTLNKSEAVREEYLQRFENHRNWLRETASRRDWTYCFHSTSQSAGQTLSTIYFSLQEEKN
ncbi:MAG: DUF58 domain-containing protein [Sneathiellales bacterium]|nr:DUF58 domain-containing protein [Sneathiellales bacterium]